MEVVRHGQRVKQFERFGHYANLLLQHNTSRLGETLLGSIFLPSHCKYPLEFETI
jgi:hypothetical protein